MGYNEMGETGVYTRRHTHKHICTNTHTSDAGRFNMLWVHSIESHGSLMCMVLASSSQKSYEFYKREIINSRCCVRKPSPWMQEVWPKLHGNCVVKLDLDPGYLTPSIILPHQGTANMNSWDFSDPKWAYFEHKNQERG